MADKSEEKLSSLFDAAHKDRHLKLRLLSEPERVAEEWGVKLGKRETERLRKLGAFVELATELRVGSIFRCDPRVCYPVSTWLRWETVRLVRDLVKYHVFYPAPQLGRLEERINQNLRLTRAREI